MSQLGHVELLIVLAIVVMIFGVSKIPEIGSALGKSIRGFREATKDPDQSPSASSVDTDAA